ncbi:MAG: RNA ligase, Rnl2 family [Dysgonamonadaceae bacterium]|jgi:Rnl2 family RNA ligase|nr:RNA ligase, Rnl2 family [Dysgonamonadaceae bacterium]
MLEFKKYTSIENTYDKDLMEKIKLEGFENQIFVVQEKVHGSNCCFVTDGQNVRFAKRTGFVEADEKFYDYEELFARYKDKIISLFRRVKSTYADLQSLSIFGEMFGGVYPHPNVKNDAKVQNIQKGVFYSPVHEFYGFDLYISGNETSRYLPVDAINAFFEAENFFYAKTLFQGNLDECLQYPNAFQSHIAECLGLPPIADNICEGIVIRPVEPVYFRNGSRLLLKSKNSRFAEKKSVKKREPALFVEPSYSESLKELLPIAEAYVTENRLNNVISKIGHVSIPKDMGKLIGLLSKDTLEDFLKEHSGRYASLEKSEQKILNTHVNKNVTSLLKKVYFNI